MRHALAVLAGFTTWTLLFLLANQITFRLFRDRFDENMVTTDSALLGLTLFLTSVFSVIAGWVTARFAPEKPVAHGLGLGVLQTLIGLGVQSAYWNVLPTWYNIAFVLLLMPATLAGATLWSSRSATQLA